ncbi:MAG: sigma-70 family RNA polymerase sigma factor, partial [Planctomycetota bacterium]|nr:sigma-70 family RNA polymerase sigma factor [Planctomycetota bacterium]
YDRHQQRVLNVALRVLGDWGAAQDVAQEVFVRLERSIRTFRRDASFVSWIYRITVNRAIDHRRRMARRPAAKMGDMPLTMETSGLPGRSEVEPTDAPVDRAEAAIRVQAALMRLSPKLRAIAVLRYVEGLSYEELAEALDCSIGTIKSRLNRAHTALHRDLGPPPEPEEA